MAQTDAIGGRARRGHDGRADRRAFRQRRRAGAAARPHRRRGARRPEARASAQARSVLHARDRVARITTGGFDTDLAKLADVDWIIEAVVEQLDVKRALLERVDAVRRPGTIVSSNTSGIPDRGARRRAERRLPPALARHAFLQPAALPAPASRSSRPPTPIRRSSSACRSSPITASARASSSRRTRRTSSPTTSGSTA